MAKRLIAPCVASSITALLSACGENTKLFQRDDVETSEEAANVYVSAYPPVPWSAIKDKLEPKHNMTTEQACAIAVQSTQSQVAQLISTFAAGLAIGLPTNTRLTTTTDTGDTETRTSTRTRGTGAVPASSGTPAATIADTALNPDLSKALTSAGIDANTLLTACTAVFQQAAILDNQISKGDIPSGYRVHLLTLQINLQPKRRNLSLDTYINVSLLPNDWATAIDATKDIHDKSGALSPVMVYPLIITDALETTSIGRSVEIIKQAALQLSGAIYGVGVAAGALKGTDKLESVIGSDKNSLVTVGRVSDHTLRIRLGAQNSGTAGAAVVPRTHNVSMIVLSRWEDDKSKSGANISALSAVTQMEMMDDSGKTKPSGYQRSPDRLAAQVARLVWQYGFDPPNDKCEGGSSNLKTPPPLLVRLNEVPNYKRDPDAGRYLSLLRAVDRADYNHIAECLNLKKDLPVDQELTLRRFIAALVGIQSTSRYSKLTIPFSDPAFPVLPMSSQVILYTDDGDGSTSLTLRNGKSLNAKALTAALLIPSKEAIAEEAKRKAAAAAKAKRPAAQGKDKSADKEKEASEDSEDQQKSPPPLFLPTAISTSDEGSVVHLNFPSLKRLGIEDVQLGKMSLVLALKDGSVYYHNLQKYGSIAAPPSNPVRVAQPIVVADNLGNGRVTLQVGKINKDLSAPLRILVMGADLRENTAIGAARPDAKGISISAETLVTLSLGNLTPSRPITIRTVDSTGGGIGESILLTVEPALSAAR